MTRGFIKAIEPLTGKVVWKRQTASFWDGAFSPRAVIWCFRATKTVTSTSTPPIQARF